MDLRRRHHMGAGDYTLSVSVEDSEHQPFCIADGVTVATQIAINNISNWSMTAVAPTII